MIKSLLQADSFVKGSLEKSTYNTIKSENKLGIWSLKLWSWNFYLRSLKLLCLRLLYQETSLTQYLHFLLEISSDQAYLWRCLKKSPYKGKYRLGTWSWKKVQGCRPSWWRFKIHPFLLEIARDKSIFWANIYLLVFEKILIRSNIN